METREELRQRVRTEQEIIARLKTAAVRFADSQTECTWAIVSAHRAGLSIRKIALATGLSSSRTHQLLKEVDASEIPKWLSRARESNLQIFALRVGALIIQRADGFCAILPAVELKPLCFNESATCLLY